MGIVLGIYSAHLAAWSIDSVLRNPTVATSRQQLFEKQLRGRLEIARSLALPRYRNSGQVSEEAKGALALESNTIKKLMKTVSSLTNRSDNFNTMTNGGAGIEINEDQLRIIEKLEVA